jgi:hypothetical protein
MAKLVYPQIKFELGGIVFSRQTGNLEMEGEWIDTALPQPENIKAWQEFVVVEQQPMGFKTITQPTHPYAIWHLSFNVVTMTKEDHYNMLALSNWIPYRVFCASLGEAKLMWLVRKQNDPVATGNPEYTFKYSITLMEANDNSQYGV